MERKSYTNGLVIANGRFYYGCYQFAQILTNDNEIPLGVGAGKGKIQHLCCS